ncbi:malic enzyme [Kiloniella litopenaei]|uniref:Malic enzyme n=1 Tax=Kiloniella litopenaei TaxID=1549748 RepID=A0A0M2R591_9PROT|nr:NADP-dependent malic enzyme [Kiloniella litopenaei]KKJ76831.1 malic enzyme [Kiloniella litopenaei]
MTQDLRDAALFYHRYPTPGKLEISATKPLGNQRDLALAYSPGVAAACEVIVDDPAEASTVTSRGNLVGVISNGTAVLGLGAIGPLASKPVMEGKAVLFKKFAGIDVFDIEIDETDPDKLINVISALEPTFGGINLEDIKAPECFIVEDALREKMNIPVFHDDQHGTAIIVAAAIYNALRLVKKKKKDVKVVASGAGAAALACLNLLVSLGIDRKNIWVTDIEGVVYEGREKLMDRWKSVFAQKTDARTLSDVIDGADIFLGLSAPGVLKPDYVKRMAKNPVIMALANPTPEIMPEEVKAIRDDAIMATGRSDYPNQVNNVLCFPYIFRGALDVGATAINEEMKVACVKAIADLAMEEQDEIVIKAMGGEAKNFGPEYIIPSPFDPRLISIIAPAVAKAAMDTGVASRPIEDFEAYCEKLKRFVYRSGLVMKPLFERAKKDPKRVIYAEGEDERVLRAVQIALDEKIATPVVVGRPDVVQMRMDKVGIKLKVGKDFEIINPQDDPRYNDYWTTYHSLMERKGISPETAKVIVRTRNTVIAALAVYRGDADAMICGVTGGYHRHLKHVRGVLGLQDGISDFSSINLMLMPSGTYFMADTYVTQEPTSKQLAETTILAAKHVSRFGLKPRVALLSHSNFGSSDSESACRVRKALSLIEEMDPELEVEGEMHADAALDPELRHRVFPNSNLTGPANLLIFPNLDAANIAFNLMKTVEDGLPVGPILVGAAQPAHILTPSVTGRGVVNMTAVAVVDAQNRERRIKK